MPINHAAIVPLIGGMPLGSEKAFGKRPEYFISYSPFEANDRQIVEYYNNEVPYYLIDKNEIPINLARVDVVSATCPCAGLSSFSSASSASNKTNDWMLESAHFVLQWMKPKVFWGENAPRLASKMGRPVVDKLKKIAFDNGYKFSLYKTKSKLHGLSQIRDRTFYFFWRDESIPLLPYFNRPHERIEDLLRKVKGNDSMHTLINDTKPSEEPFYRYCLEEIEGGLTHKEFSNKIEKTTFTYNHIEDNNHTFNKVADWMKEKDFISAYEKCLRIDKKLREGKGIMRRVTTIPKDYIGAFVGHYPWLLTHPDEDRYLTLRECLAIMKMPNDFELIGGRKNTNMICQNVPVTTAEDMANGVKQYLDGTLDKIDTSFLIQDNRNQSHFVEHEKYSLEEFI